MTIFFIMILAAVLGPGGLPPRPTAYDAAHPPAVVVQQPTPPPEEEGPRPRVSLAVLLALVCVFNLSVIALLGSIALRRRIDRVSPDN